MRTKPAKFIKQTRLKMAEENAIVLVNNPQPHVSGTRRIMSEVRVEVTEEVEKQGSQRYKEKGLALLAVRSTPRSLKEIERLRG